MHVAAGWLVHSYHSTHIYALLGRCFINVVQVYKRNLGTYRQKKSLHQRYILVTTHAGNEAICSQLSYILCLHRHRL